jgi:hypothetical protein
LSLHGIPLLLMSQAEQELPPPSRNQNSSRQIRR